MRKVLAFLLLASAAVPAMAAPGDHHGWQSNDESNKPAKADNRARGDGDRPHANRDGGDNNGGQQRPQFEARQRPQFQVQQHEQVQVQQQPVTQVQSNGGGNDARRFNGFRTRFNGGQQQQQTVIESERRHDGDANDGVRNWRGPKVIESGDRQAAYRQSNRDGLRIFGNRVPVISNTPHEGTQPALRNGRQRNVQWSTNWRHDDRYDWRNYRNRHRSTFHLGLYFDPFGWNYRPYQVGWRLWPNYYSSNYWISDPYEYRLPYAPPGTRWVRYYDDALLVDTWSGQVVDVIYNFFW